MPDREHMENHEFSRSAPRFTERERNGEYERDQVDPETEEFSRMLGTRSPDIAELAQTGHQILRDSTPVVNQPWGELDPEDPAHAWDRFRRGRIRRSILPPGERHQRAIHSYSVESRNSHATTRLQNNVPYYEWKYVPGNGDQSPYVQLRSPMNEHLYSSFWSGRARSRLTVRQIERALSSMPPATLDARRLNPDSRYEGNMVFRGALATDPATGTPVYARANEGSSSGDQVRRVRPGDFVTNTDVMSTSAIAAVAGEFVMRQRQNVMGDPKRTKVPQKEQARHDPRRVLFTINHGSGRNIARYTREKQAEVLFCRGAVFRVEDVVKSDYGNIVRLSEVPSGAFWREDGTYKKPPELPEGTAVYNMATGREVRAIDVLGPDTLPPIPEEDEDSGGD